MSCIICSDPITTTSFSPIICTCACHERMVARVYSWPALNQEVLCLNQAVKNREETIRSQSAIIAEMSQVIIDLRPKEKSNAT